jgi:hypothetical protein
MKNFQMETNGMSQDSQNQIQGEAASTALGPETTDQNASVNQDREPELPEKVTEEPQDREQLDLSKVKPYKKWLRTYLDVSDDAGDFLGDNALEKEVKKLCKELDLLDLGKEKNPESLIEKIRETLIRYASSVNRSENRAIGIVTKYRIRQGVLLLHQKTLVTKRLHKNWTEWFKENYDASLLRSSQDYMRIAAISNSIRYAVFGKERLIAIIRQIPYKGVDDPIGKFLSENGINFSPEDEPDREEIQLKADIAVNRQILLNEGLAEIPSDKVESFVRLGNDLTKKHIQALKLVKQKGKNLNDYMDALIASGGKTGPITTPESKAESFKNTIVTFLNKATDAVNDGEYLTQINLDLCRELKEKIEQLERLISSRQSS